MKKYNREELTKMLQDNPEELINKMLEFQNSKKKYGLVWEENNEQTKEEFEKSLETHLPTLEEVKDREIKTDISKPTNLLIEGDNYHALKLLQTTHKNKIDVIYIDPPYNTGNKDFVYNDKYIDKEDGYRHSKWLNFMSKRLKLARELLSDDGVIFISIDDNEMAQLKLLCDEIFWENNFIQNFMWLHGKGKKDNQSRTMQQYTLAFSKNKKNLNKWVDKVFVDYKFENPDNDPKGQWFSGSISFNENRSNKNHENYYTIHSPSGISWTRQWQVSKSDMDSLIKNGDIYFGNSPNFKNVPRLKIRPSFIEVIPSNVIENKGTTKKAINELKEIFNGNELFSYPKPIELIKYFMSIINKKNIIVLDFFAGSGTTGHAILELNKEDNGSRQFILCTNNEISEEKEKNFFKEKGFLGNMSLSEFKETNEYRNHKEKDEYQNLGICREVTYQRLNKVINGYTTPKGKKVEGLGGNLKYYKCDFIEKEEDMTDNIDNYQKYATELLKIKEDTFDLYKEESTYSIFTSDKKMLICINEIDNQKELINIKEELKKYSGEIIIYIKTAEGNPTIPTELEEYQNYIKSTPKEIIDILSK